MEHKGAHKNLQDHVLEKKRKKWENGTKGGIQKIFKTMFLKKKEKNVRMEQ